MKWRSAALLLCVCMLFSCTACQSEQDDIYSQAMKKVSYQENGESSGESSAASSQLEDTASADPTETPFEVNTSLSGELLIKCFLHSSNPGKDTNMECLANEFMERYPNVRVMVSYSFDGSTDAEETAQAREAYYSQVRTELVSGEADYLLFGPADELNFYELGESGVFLDLRPYWEDDPEVDQSEYFMEVLDALSVEGKMLGVPLSFTMDGFFLDRRWMEKLGVDTEDLTAVSCLTLLDWYDQLKTDEKDLQVTYGAWTQELAVSQEKTAYLDLETRTANFTDPGFVDLLSRTRELEEADQSMMQITRIECQDVDILHAMLRCLATGEDFPVKNLPDIQVFLDSSHPALAAYSGITPDTLGYVNQPLEYLAGPYVAADSKGRVAVQSVEDFFIPSSMDDPDLAWELVKYCVSRRETIRLANNQLYTLNIPLNKENYALLVDAINQGEGYLYRYGKMQGAAMNEYDSQAGLAKLEEFLSLPLINGKLYGLDVDEYLEEFYEQKLTTAEECAQKIQGRAEIWLNE